MRYKNKVNLRKKYILRDKVYLPKAVGLQIIVRYVIIIYYTKLPIQRRKKPKKQRVKAKISIEHTAKAFTTKSRRLLTPSKKGGNLRDSLLIAQKKH